MDKRCVPALLIAATIASNAYCATGNLVIFDDTDENGFDRPSASCSTDSSLENALVHSGSYAILVPKFDNDGAGWVAQTTYSTSADYDGVSFWINAGSAQTTLTSLAVVDGDGNSHFLHLEAFYGAPLPANTWIQLQIPFSSPGFEAASSSPPDTVKTLCVINHSGGAGYLFIDDVALTGADIFKNGFDN